MTNRSETDLEIARKLQGLPGADIVIQGLLDLESDARTESALAVSLIRRQLSDFGIEVPFGPEIEPPIEHRLYELLEDLYCSDAYSRYNAIRRRIASFVHSMEQGELGD